MRAPPQPLKRLPFLRFQAPPDSRSGRFFRAWWLSELPHQANHSAYFGLVSLTSSTIDDTLLLLLDKCSDEDPTLGRLSRASPDLNPARLALGLRSCLSGDSRTAIFLLQRALRCSDQGHDRDPHRSFTDSESPVRRKTLDRLSASVTRQLSCGFPGPPLLQAANRLDRGHPRVRDRRKSRKRDGGFLLQDLDGHP